MKNLTRFIDLSNLKFIEGDSKIVREMQIMPVGTWQHPEYGEIKITEKDITEFVNNFNDSIRKDVPIDIEHKTDSGAVGWVNGLIDKGSDGLWASIEWTKKGQQLVQDKTFKYFSPEFATDYEDPQTHNTHKNVLMGGALTNRPYFKELDSIELSENIKKVSDKTMPYGLPNETPEQTAKMDKCVKGLMSDEDFKPENPSQDKKSAAVAVCKVKLGYAAKEKKNTEKDEKKTKEKTKLSNKKNMAEKKETKEVKKEDTQKFKEGEVGIQASELKQLREKSKKLETMEIKKDVSQYLFSETTKKGRFSPKSEDKLVSFVASLSEDTRKAFYELVDEMPVPKYFKEMGSSENKEATKVPKDVDEDSFKLNEKAEEILSKAKKDNKEMTLTEAMLEAEKELSK